MIETKLELDLKYCVFIDVLGYKNIVLNSATSQMEKKAKLESIYNNMMASFYTPIKTINNKTTDSIFIKSFSDCFYLESKNLGDILIALQGIYNIAICFNDGINNHSSIIRGGIVYDWTSHFIDISSFIRHEYNDIIPDKGQKLNPEFTNIVGPGIARSFLISEKSKLSGMRMIISPEVLNISLLNVYDKVDFECYYFELKEWDNKKLFFCPILTSENSTNEILYELCWCANNTYDFNTTNIRYKSRIQQTVDELIRMKNNFPKEEARHYRETLIIVKKAIEINLTLTNDSTIIKELNSNLSVIKDELQLLKTG